MPGNYPWIPILIFLGQFLYPRDGRHFRHGTTGAFDFEICSVKFMKNDTFRYARPTFDDVGIFYRFWTISQNTVGIFYTFWWNG